MSWSHNFDLNIIKKDPVWIESKHKMKFTFKTFSIKKVRNWVLHIIKAEPFVCVLYIYAG